MILILFKASIIIAFLIIFFKLFLEKESFFATNRIYLLACLILPLMLPFVVIPKLVDHQGILTSWIDIEDIEANQINSKTEIVDLEISEQTGVVAIGEKHYDRQDPESSKLTKTQIIKSQGKIKSLSYYLIVMYLLGVFVFMLHFLSQLYRLMKNIYQTTDKEKNTNCTIVNLKSNIEPCSFFRFVFISPEYYDHNTYHRILKHELTHVRLWHSIDLILAELAVIILWFNPFIWLLRKEIEKNIEYQTDQILINDKNIDNLSYQMSLIGLGTKMKPLSLTINYNQSLIKQRILKMNSKRSNPLSYCKYAFVLPLVFTLLLIVNQPTDTLANQARIETTHETNYLDDTATQNTVSITTSNEAISENSNNTESKTSIGFNNSKNATLTQSERNKKKVNSIDPDPILKNSKTNSNRTKKKENKSRARLLESKKDTLENFKLYQNEPNPFRSETVIGFDLPRAASATLTVYNVEGEFVKTVNGDFVKGYNKIKITKADIVNKSIVPAVLYYKLDYEEFSATKKMILIDGK